MKYGLIGEHLGHSYSPEIHACIADYTYELKELAPSALAEFFTARDFCGINVTIPYKQAVIPFLDGISESAKKIGAVNTVVNRNGKLYGDNTDYAGMRALAVHLGLDFTDKKVLILGTGGTSKTALAVAEDLGAAEIHRVSRHSGENVITYGDAVSLHSDADILINTTPVGMYPSGDKSPIELDAFSRLSGVLDVVYNPLNTPLVLNAEHRGIPAAGGLYMLAAQAVYASAQFLGKDADEALIEKAYRAVRESKRNIVLTGMPTSGKTTVGKLLSALTGKEFYDIDNEILSKIDGTIADYMHKNGEPAFRALEREAVASLSEKSGCIIATGGGTVMDERNADALRRNGLIVFLDRPLSMLAALPDRPLSAEPEKLRAMYEARYPVYLSRADVTVAADGTPEEIANQILKENAL